MLQHTGPSRPHFAAHASTQNLILQLTNPPRRSKKNTFFECDHIITSPKRSTDMIVNASGVEFLKENNDIPLKTRNIRKTL